MTLVESIGKIIRERPGGGIVCYLIPKDEDAIYFIANGKFGVLTRDQVRTCDNDPGKCVEQIEWQKIHYIA